MHRLNSWICLCAIFSLANAAEENSNIEKREAFILDSCEQSVSQVAGLQLQILIEDMDRAVQLDPKVRKRLELAAKGAALKYGEQQIKKDKQVITRQIADHLPPDAENFILNSEVIDVSQFKTDEDQPDEVGEQQDGADSSEPKEIYPKITFRFQQKRCGWNFRHDRGSSGYGVSGGFDEVLKTEPWKRTYDELISDDQKTQYEEFKNARVRKALSEMLLGYLELQLRLTSEQKPKVKDWLTSEVNVSQVDHLGNYGALFENTIKSLPRDGIDDILSDQQLQVWRKLVASQ